MEDTITNDNQTQTPTRKRAAKKPNSEIKFDHDLGPTCQAFGYPEKKAGLLMKVGCVWLSREAIEKAAAKLAVHDAQIRG